MFSSERRRPKDLPPVADCASVPESKTTIDGDESKGNEMRLSRDETKEDQEEEDLVEMGESHGKVLAALVISKIFLDEVSSTDCVELGEFVDRVVGVVYAHFELTKPPTSTPVVGSFSSAQQQQGLCVSSEANTALLKLLSEEIAQGIVSQLPPTAAQSQQTVNAKDLARVLRTCHLELVKKAVQSEDLKIDLTQVLAQQLRATLALGNPNGSESLSLDEMVAPCVERAVAVLSSRVYLRDDGVGDVGEGAGVVVL
jgi:hypothetical protein